MLKTLTHSQTNIIKLLVTFYIRILKAFQLIYVLKIDFPIILIEKNELIVISN